MTDLQRIMTELFESLDELDVELRGKFSKLVRGVGARPLEEMSTTEKIKFAKLVLQMQGLDIPRQGKKDEQKS